MSSAGTPQWTLTSSGENSAARLRMSSRPLTWSAMPPRSVATRPLRTAHARRRTEGTVGARAWSDVAVGQFGGAGARRIDHGELAAALAQRPQLAGEVGGGGQTAVGHKGIRTDDHQIVGAVEIGHRERDRAAEHMAQRNVFGHLVQGAGGERLDGAEPADDQRRVQAARDGVRVGVAQIRRPMHRRARERPRPAGRRRRRTPRPTSPRSARRHDGPAAVPAGRDRCRVRRSSRPSGR